MEQRPSLINPRQRLLDYLKLTLKTTASQDPPAGGFCQFREQSVSIQRDTSDIHLPGGEWKMDRGHSLNELMLMWTPETAKYPPETSLNRRK